jgi:hypothetical protein
MNAQRNGDEILARRAITLCQSNANINLVKRDNGTNHTERDAVGFSGRIVLFSLQSNTPKVKT